MFLLPGGRPRRGVVVEDLADELDGRGVVEDLADELDGRGVVEDLADEYRTRVPAAPADAVEPVELPAERLRGDELDEDGPGCGPAEPPKGRAPLRG